ncbi:tail fiber domain-containing protein [Halobacteriovorax marinus]|uniref:tail fiber domain-containing protein n=1 Tax=Halobacteriovorax marinus TaxID=97084 RepID=UPI003A8E3329
MSENKQDKAEKKDYYFGGIQEFSLEEIESEVLNESVYLDVFAGSDPSFKENVAAFNDGLDLVSKLNVYEYDYKVNDYPEYNFSSDHQIGLMANELEGVIPSMVVTNSEGKKLVDYSKLTPVLAKAVQQLSKTVEEQQKVIDDLKKKLM